MYINVSLLWEISMEKATKWYSCGKWCLQEVTSIFIRMISVTGIVYDIIRHETNEEDHDRNLILFLG